MPSSSSSPPSPPRATFRGGSGVSCWGGGLFPSSVHPLSSPVRSCLECLFPFHAPSSSSRTLPRFPPFSAAFLSARHRIRREGRPRHSEEDRGRGPSVPLSVPLPHHVSKFVSEFGGEFAAVAKQPFTSILSGEGALYRTSPPSHGPCSSQIRYLLMRSAELGEGGREGGGDSKNGT